MTKNANESTGGDERAATPATLPTDQVQDAGLSLPAAEPVIALRVVGANLELSLSPEKRTFTLGSAEEPDVDLRLTSAMASGDRSAKEHISRIHLLIQRKGSRLWIKDQDSTNGTFVNDRRERDADISAGKTFRLGDVTLLAMDEQMRLLRPHLLWVLGLGAHAYVDKMLEVIATGEPLLLVGEAGCDQLALAEQIHSTSARRHQGFVRIPPPLATRPEQVALLAQASRGTAFIDLARFAHLPAFFVSHLFGDSYHVRPIIAAPDFSTAAKQLGDQHAPTLRVITIPAIRDRRVDVPRLLDTFFRRLDSTRRVVELGDDKVARLMAFEWPDNLADLQRNAPRILALVESGGNIRAAARALNVSHTALMDALGRIGLRD